LKHHLVTTAVCLLLAFARTGAGDASDGARREHGRKISALLEDLADERRQGFVKAPVPRADSVSGAIVGTVLDAELARLEDGTPFTVMRIRVAAARDQEVMAVCIGELAFRCVETEE
jgi:hypothetical protein